MSGLEQEFFINTNTDKYGINYSGLISPMIKAFQEQQVIIEQLQKQVKTLENKINQLEQS